MSVCVNVGGCVRENKILQERNVIWWNERVGVKKFAYLNKNLYLFIKFWKKGVCVCASRVGGVFILKYALKKLMRVGEGGVHFVV